MLLLVGRRPPERSEAEHLRPPTSLSRPPVLIGGKRYLVLPAYWRRVVVTGIVGIQRRRSVLHAGDREVSHRIARLFAYPLNRLYRRHGCHATVPIRPLPSTRSEKHTESIAAPACQAPCLPFIRREDVTAPTAGDGRPPPHARHASVATPPRPLLQSGAQCLPSRHRPPAPSASDGTVRIKTRNSSAEGGGACRYGHAEACPRHSPRPSPSPAIIHAWQVIPMSMAGSVSSSVSSEWW